MRLKRLSRTTDAVEPKGLVFKTSP
jgi:hypothetical protein